MLNKFKLRWHLSYKVNKLREKRRRLFSKHEETKVIFVFGCQRSGTTLIQKIIALNPDIKMIGEGEQPYFYPPTKDQPNRIKPAAEIKPLLLDEVFSFIVLKPLYESQSANSLISQYPGSKAVWIFRNYLDVIDSHIHYYEHSAKEYIKPFYDKKSSSWLNESIPDDILRFVNKFNLKEISDADAYALFWIVRNGLYWNVKDSPNVLLINYEDFVKQAPIQIVRLGEFLKIPTYQFYNSFIKKNAISKNILFGLNPEIESQCKIMYQQLVDNYQYKQLMKQSFANAN